MGVYNTYYFNGVTLAQATSVYTDSALTVLAADGWYSDGVSTREQTAGVLGPELVCPDCYLPCSQEVADTNNVSGGGVANHMGTYSMVANLSDSVGAVIVRVRTSNKAAGLIVKYGSSYTTRSNKFSASDGGGANGGYRGAINTTPLTAVDKPLWVGSGANIDQTVPPAACAGVTTPPNLPNNAPFTGSGVASPHTLTGGTLPSYAWQADPNQFVAGANQNIIIETQQVQLGAGSGDWMMAVIPKTQVSPSTLTVEVQNGACASRTYVSVYCPVQLTGFNTSSPQDTLDNACTSVVDSSFFIYNAPGAQGIVSGLPANVYEFGVPNLYDFAFKDANGEVYADAGFYRYNYTDPTTGEVSAKFFEVDQYGVIVQTNIECTTSLAPAGESIQVSGLGPGTFNYGVAMGAATGVMVVRFSADAIAESFYARHISGGTNYFYNMLSSSGMSPGNNCYGYLEEINYDGTTNYLAAVTAPALAVGGGTRNTASGGGEPLPYPPNDYEGVWVGRVIDSDCNGTARGYVKYPFSNCYWDEGLQVNITPNNLKCGNGAGMGKLNLPTNGVHNSSPDQYGSVWSGSTCQTPTSTPPTDGTDYATMLSPWAYSNGDFVYPDSTTNFASGVDLFDVYAWNESENEWASDGLKTPIIVKTRQVQISATHPSMMMCVIPKPVATQETTIITIKSIVCNSGFVIWTEAVGPINTINSGGTVTVISGATPFTSSAAACAAPVVNTDFYVVHGAYERDNLDISYKTPGVGTSNLIQNLPYLNDLLFKDVNGVNKADAGYYKCAVGAGFRWFRVDEYGVIADMGTC